MLVPYSMRQAGGGDVKLAAAVGSLLGPWHGAFSLATGLLLAGCACLARSLSHAGWPWHSTAAAGDAAPRLGFHDEFERKVPLAPCMALGAWLVQDALPL
jgi:Flp pilus assembly protein protease CpaA